ncbi:MAG: LicD family protein [Chloroflexi bacterium]|nr:LicD family protein [Chloroflexota bacterium]
MTSLPPVDITPDEDFYRAYFPDVRETGETPLRQCQLVMIRMLKIFDHLCRRHAIPYWISDGTLLGAVRHQGFIPWDGDVDISMLRSDFERFVAEAAGELPRDIFLQTPDTDPFYTNRPQYKLRDRYSSYVGYERAYGGSTPLHNGLMVDIWRYDLASSKLVADLKNLRTRQGRRSESRYIGFGDIYQFSHDHIFSLHALVFEGLWLPAPNDYEGYLRFHYGDYMQLPPESARHPHEGAMDAFTPSNHPASLRWEERGRARANAESTQASSPVPSTPPADESAHIRGFRESLQLLHDTLADTPLACRYWVWGGLLIGWAREGRILSHDVSDADFAFLREHRARFLNAIHALKAAGFVPSKRWINNEGDATEYVFVKGSAKFEFFEMVRQGDEFCYWLYNRPVEFACRIPSHGLAAMTFLDRLWQKPDDHDKHLTAVYGEWCVPDPNYTFLNEKSIVESYPWRGTNDWIE